MRESDYRANVLFKLCECFPDLATRQEQFRRVSPLVKQLEWPDGSKWILSYTADEAGQLADYWIDTEHLVLGILREHSCAAALRLNGASIYLHSAREMVAGNKSSRPDYGPVPWLWRMQSRLLKYW